MGLYAYAFFKFGWAYRLFNYSAVMLAATPEAGQPGAEEAAEGVAEMNIAAAGQFTHGLRAFFLAIAVLAWFITWWAFVDRDRGDRACARQPPAQFARPVRGYRFLCALAGQRVM